MAKLPQVDGCCGCITLRTGALIIGILSLVGTAIIVLTCLGASGTVFVMAQHDLSWANNVTSESSLIGYGDWKTEGNSSVDGDMAADDYQNGHHMTPEEKKTFFLILGGALLVLTIFLVIPLSFDIMLVVGIVKNKPRLVRAWVVFRMICLSVAIFSFFFSLFRLAISGHFGLLGSSILGSIVNLAVSLYFLIVVNSHYRVMLSNDSQDVILPLYKPLYKPVDLIKQ